MKKYKYEAFDPDGNRRDGIVSADSLEKVIFKILQAKLYPTRIEELTGSTYVAHSRLEKLKEIKRRLEPEEAPQELPPQSRRRDDGYSKLLFIVVVALWLAMVAVYVVLQQFG
jgi:hypothetical protein